MSQSPRQRKTCTSRSSRRRPRARQGFVRLTPEPLESRKLLAVVISGGDPAVGSSDLLEMVTVSITEKDLRTGEERTYTRQIAAGSSELGELTEMAGLVSGVSPGAFPEDPGRYGVTPGNPDGSPAIDPRFVFGPDGRSRVEDTTASPFSAVVQIAALSSTNSMSYSSGAMVSEFHVLTAAHCIRDSTTDGSGFANRVRVAPGNNGDHWGGRSYDELLQSTNRWYGEAEGVYMRSYTWSTTDWDYDIALVTLDRSIGSPSFGTGYFGYGFNDSNAFFLQSWNSAGYPGDRNPGWNTHHQFYAYDPITTALTHQVRSNQLDINPGNSGGPLWFFDGVDQHVIYGVASHMSSSGGVPSYNSWTRITSDKFNEFRAAIDADKASATNRPTDRPDLVDWDGWFNSSFAGTSSSSVMPGQPFQVTSFPRNNGTAAAGAFTVRYRLSLDRSYDASDTFLGDVRIDGLSPFRFSEASFVTNSFPNVSAGSYYVVWHVDAINDVLEFDGLNNTGSLRTTITVLPATAPEIDVRGNGFSIADGDTTPTISDHTDFGSTGTLGGTVTRTFTIANTGAGILSLTGTPRVQVSGSHAADFVVAVAPVSSVAANSSTTFQVTFDPSAVGLRTATISIANNDANENPYNFTIQGLGTESGAEIRGFKWNDLDGDAIWDGGEPALSGWTIYLDLDRDGVLDAGEPSRTTASNGSYAFTGLAPGTYTVAEVPQVGWQQTYPGPSGATSQTVATSAVALQNLPSFEFEHALQRAADLSTYTAAELAQATQWVVQLVAGGSAANLAAALSARLIGPAPYLNDAYIVEFAGAVVEEAAPRLAALTEAVLFFPLVGRKMDARFVPNDPLFTQQWHLRNTGQNTGGVSGEDARVVTAWDTAKGNGVVIGIVDDGLQHTHPDLAGRYASNLSFDFVSNDSDPMPPSNFGHGTSAAGVAAATGNNGVGVSGAAPAATLAGLRLLSAASQTDQQEANALGFKPQDIDIYNNSWGPIDSGELLEAPGPLALAALRNGVVAGRGGLGSIYVWAAGNGLQSGDNVNYDGYANSRYTIAVSAIDNRGIQSFYSEPGAPILVAAHSEGNDVGVTTTDITGSGGYSTGDYTNNFGGTSSAAPLVAGVTALMLEANPALSWRDVQHVLVNSARRNHAADSDWSLNGAGRWVNHKYGFGAVDAAAAVALADNWTPVGPEVSISSPTITVGTGIPDDNATGITSSFTVGEDISVEWVEVVFDATHSYRGDLEVVLTSPSGTRSILSSAHFDGNANYSGWQFTSARHWGESSAGQWKLTVADRGAADTGTWNSWKLNFHGTAENSVLPGTHSVTLTAGSVRQSVNFGARLIAPPEIDVRGNGVSIIDGDTTPSTSDHTDFGSTNASGGTVTRTFTVANTGTGSLSLTGSPSVQVSGSHAADFVVTASPASSISANSTTTFQVRFDPSAAGLRTAMISIANTDANENPYNFTIQGTGVTAAPEMDVRGNGTSIADGDFTPTATDHTDFGLVNTAGGTVVRTFTIANTGTGSLSLTGSPSVQVSGSHAADFVVTASPASSVAANGTTTFQVRFDPSATGLRSARITIANNDANENPYDFSIQGTGVEPTVTEWIIDDRTPGFRRTGAGWRNWFGSSARGGVLLYSAPRGRVLRTASWEFGDLQPGRYEALATWSVHRSHGTNVPFRMQAGSGPVQLTRVNQRQAPSDVTDTSGWSWGRLGTVTITTESSLRVWMTNQANGYVIADAVRLVRLPDEPEIVVEGNGLEIVSDFTAPNVFHGTDFGLVDPDAQSKTQTFTIRNTGTRALNLTGSPRVRITGSEAAEFTVVTQPAASVAAGGQTSFSIRFDPAAFGRRTATVLIASNDSDEGSFSFGITGTGGTERIIDDRTAGFRRAGRDWRNWAGSAAYGGSLLYAPRAGRANAAHWTFDDLAAGEYVVMATWPAHRSHSTSVTYSIFDGDTLATTATANQRRAPNDEFAGLQNWERLGTLDVTGGSLRVTMTNRVSRGFVIADAIRIVRVGTATAAATDQARLFALVAAAQAEESATGRTDRIKFGWVH